MSMVSYNRIFVNYIMYNVFFNYHFNRVYTWSFITLLLVVSLLTKSSLLKECFKITLLKMTNKWWIIMIVCLCGHLVYLIIITNIFHILHVFFILMTSTRVNYNLTTSFLLLIWGKHIFVSMSVTYFFLYKVKV